MYLFSIIKDKKRKLVMYDKQKKQKSTHPYRHA